MLAPHDRSTPSGRYERRRPEETVLYQVVAENLLTFLEMTDELGPLPAFIRRDLERFLACGILAHGFARVRCEDCGDMLAVAFSCKGRTCPSCRSRLASQTAANLVDRVLPEVPFRHVVLTLPVPIRHRLASDPDTTSAVLRSWMDVLAAWIRERAAFTATPECRAEIGAVTGIHRGGSDLRLNVHFHTLVTSGVFIRGAAPDGRTGPLEFVPIDDPSPEDVLALEASAARGIVLLLEKRGVLVEGEILTDDDSELLGRCRAAAATGRIAFGPRAGAPVDREGAFDLEPAGRRPRREHGFDLFLGPAVDDRAQLERLCGYLARPPVAAGRLSWRDDGRVRLALPRPWADGTVAIVLDRLDLISRIAALIPRPFSNLTRYHGILAPNAAWRDLVIPAKGRSIPRRRRGRTSGGSWIPWAELLRRTIYADLLACPCGGKRVVIAFITWPDAIRDILECIGLPTEPPPIAPSWWNPGRILWN